MKKPLLLLLSCLLLPVAGYSSDLFHKNDTLIPCCTSPEELGFNDTVLQSGIDSVMAEALLAKAFPGAQVLIARKGKIVYHKSWGFHTYDSLRPVLLDDIYDFASITKTAAALPGIMKMIDDEKVHLDAPLRTFYPEFYPSDKSEMTLRRLLTHTAGLKAWIPFWRATKKKNGKFKRRIWRRDSSRRFPLKVTENLYLHKNYRRKIFKAIRKSPVSEEGKYVYSDMGFYLYPEVIEQKYDMPFEEFLKENFYEKIGANSLTFNAYRHFPLKRIIPTERDTFFRMEQIHGRVHDEGAIMLGGISGHAGLFGTAEDLAKLYQMYLNGGEYGGRQFLKKETIHEFTRVQYPQDSIRRGIGFDKPLLKYHPQKSSTAKDASPATFGHSGYTGTLVWADPEYDLLYIFLSNRVHPSRLSRAIYDLNIRPRIHQVIYDSILKNK